MKILALDTSNQPLSVALVDDKTLVAQTTTNLAKNHSVYLMPVIDQLMKMAKWLPTDLDRIVVADGPGSYTGIRIAVTTAKTLAMTLGIELVGVSSLKLLAANSQFEHELIVPLMDARRSNVFTGGYTWSHEVLMTQLPDMHSSVEDLAVKLATCDQPIVFVCENFSQYEATFKQQLDNHFHVAPMTAVIPSAYQLGILGYDATPVAEIDSFVPNSLRLTQAETEWKQNHPGAGSDNYVQEI